MVEQSDHPSGGIRALQEKILEITLYLDEFCRENGIRYYLMGGSALGAMRHRGFIPWDDDLDVFMTPDNYFRFLEIADDALDKGRFYLQREGTAEWPMYFSKLRMHGTTFLETDTRHREMHRGIYIDIMCLNNVHDNRFYRYAQYLAARAITAATLAKRGYSTQSLKKKIALSAADLLIGSRTRSVLLRFVRSLNSVDTHDVGHFFGRAKYQHTCFPGCYLGEPRYVDFWDEQLPVPSEVEKYLTVRYGDYMRMPDESTRDEYPVHAELFDTERDYTEFVDSAPFRV